MPRATWLPNLVSWQDLAGFSEGDIALRKKVEDHLRRFLMSSEPKEPWSSFHGCDQGMCHALVFPLSFLIIPYDNPSNILRTAPFLRSQSFSTQEAHKNQLGEN